ncbi:hypothetical protein BDV25DRAFT_140482 [Aspergillus avenaceus]|uniref:Cyanovirin-N domain-containing protein n=1 Tax=Aspergillus avenaceus TaxID=36643 RepID=A0A5N6TUH7_ASPAV|nr:hypothetical protein BDV25DRAFT_140482 [Aspergillus avenaceus]
MKSKAIIILYLPVLAASKSWQEIERCTDVNAEHLSLTAVCQSITNKNVTSTLDLQRCYYDYELGYSPDEIGGLSDHCYCFLFLENDSTFTCKCGRFIQLTYTVDFRNVIYNTNGTLSCRGILGERKD